jgi:hypothetical protein
VTARGRWFALAAAAVVTTAALLATSRQRESRAAPRAAAVHKAPGGALPVARRFLTLYLEAYAKQLDARGRADLRRIAAPGIVDVLLGQPPEERRASGRVAALDVSQVDGDESLAVASLSFHGLRTPATLVVSRGAGGTWRVSDFEPGK